MKGKIWTKIKKFPVIKHTLLDFSVLVRNEKKIFIQFYTSINLNMEIPFKPSM